MNQSVDDFPHSPRKEAAPESVETSPNTFSYTAGRQPCSTGYTSFFCIGLQTVRDKTDHINFNYRPFLDINEISKRFVHIVTF